MPRVMNQPQPQFRVHDRHPGLHGLAVLILGLVFVVAFLASVLPGKAEPSSGSAVQAAPGHS